MEHTDNRTRLAAVPLGVLELTPEPREFEFEAWIRGKQMLQLQPGDFTLERSGGYN